MRSQMGDCIHNLDDLRRAILPPRPPEGGQGVPDAPRRAGRCRRPLSALALDVLQVHRPASRVPPAPRRGRAHGGRVVPQELLGAAGAASGGAPRRSALLLLLPIVLLLRAAQEVGRGGGRGGRDAPAVVVGPVRPRRCPRPTSASSSKGTPTTAGSSHIWHSGSRRSARDSADTFTWLLTDSQNLRFAILSLHHSKCDV